MITMKKKGSVLNGKQVVERGEECDIVLGGDSVIPESDTGDIDAALEHIRAYGGNKKINKYVSEIKFQKKLKDFDDAFTKILVTLNSVELDDSKMEVIFKFVLQSLEDYVFHVDKEKRNAAKHNLAIKLLSPLCKGDSDTCQNIMKMCLKTITKTNIFRRSLKTLSKLFFLLVEKLRTII